MNENGSRFTFLYLTFKGRINRASYWLYNVLFVWLVVLVGVALDAAAGMEAPVFYLLACLLCLVPSLAMNLKRCHDRGRSGWFILVNLIPIAGGIWYFIEIACLRGTVGPNKYGPDPLQAQDVSQEEATA